MAVITGPPGALVQEPGQIQYGELLVGDGSDYLFRGLAGWRDLPAASLADSPRPQAHGSYAGSVLGDSLTVTLAVLVSADLTYPVRAELLSALEVYTRMDGVDKPLVVCLEDGEIEQRMARVTARAIPVAERYAVDDIVAQIQFVCADPRRYSTNEVSAIATPPTSIGGLMYPLVYPLEYGTVAMGSASVTNTGSEDTPIQVLFRGPLTNPRLVATDWVMGFDITLVAGETLEVDTSEGTALLNGTADRLYLIQASSSPLELCVLQPMKPTDLSLVAATGNGTATVTFRHARM